MPEEYIAGGIGRRIATRQVIEAVRSDIEAVLAWISVKRKVTVLAKASYSAAAKRELSGHGGLSFD
jgi:hypothetical protein